MRAVDSMSDGFVLFDANDRIILCNQVGISQYPRDGQDPDWLIRMADAAMDRATQSGPGRLVIHDPGLEIRNVP